MPLSIGPEQKLVFFGGKGGVGKTTLSCATALFLARENPEKSFLIASTDPAHSLTDSFDLAWSNQIQAHPQIPNLFLFQMNPNQALASFKERYGPALKKLLLRGTLFDQEDIDEFFSLSLPGLDEMMAIVSIANKIRDEAYDLILLDTAPTGHTMRLLSSPHFLKTWVHFLEITQKKFQYMKQIFSAKIIQDEADSFLQDMLNDTRRIASLFQDPQRCQFIPVVVPQPMIIAQTERLVKTLCEYRIPAHQMVVNRVTLSEDCPYCLASKKDEAAGLAQIRKKFESFTTTVVPRYDRQINGMKALSMVAQRLFADSKEKPAGVEDFRMPFPSPHAFCLDEALDSKSIHNFVQALQSKSAHVKLIFFAGKGGVGKTTLASLYAWAMTRKKPRKKILLFSLDPAHSIADRLGKEIGQEPTSVREGLWAQQIDSMKLFEQIKQQYHKEIEDAFNSFFDNLGIRIPFESEVFSNLLSMAPPGLDEVMALKKVLDHVKSGVYDLLVLDSAPTGHFLRFLQMPGLVKQWLGVFSMLLIKYRGLLSMVKTAQTLVDISNDIHQFLQLLKDPKKTISVVVTIPEAMGIAETERLLAEMKKLGVACPFVVLNQLLPSTVCPFCSPIWKSQQSTLKEAAHRLKGPTILQVCNWGHTP